jgi:hypothetical protein
MSSDTVSINVRLTPENNRIVGVYKELLGLSSKEEAINKLIEKNAEDILERPFKEEFIERIKKIAEETKKQPLLQPNQIKDAFSD